MDWYVSAVHDVHAAAFVAAEYEPAGQIIQGWVGSVFIFEPTGHALQFVVWPAMHQL